MRRKVAVMNGSYLKRTCFSLIRSAVIKILFASSCWLSRCSADSADSAVSGALTTEFGKWRALRLLELSKEHTYFDHKPHRPAKFRECGHGA